MKLEVPGGEVSALRDGPPDAADSIILATGAGADMQHEFMAAMASGLAERGVDVWRFNFLYTEKGRKSPDRQQVLETTYAAVASEVRSRISGRLFLGGKSMGGRIASHIAASGEETDGLVFLGYPLHPPGKPERIRRAHLPSVSVPMLFVEGTRDPFCPLDTLEGVLADLPAPTTVAVIDDGDHSFKVRRSSGRSTQESWQEVIEAVAGWIAAV